MREDVTEESSSCVRVCVCVSHSIVRPQVRLQYSAATSSFLFQLRLPLVRRETKRLRIKRTEMIQSRRRRWTIFDAREPPTVWKAAQPLLTASSHQSGETITPFFFLSFCLYLFLSAADWIMTDTATHELKKIIIKISIWRWQFGAINCQIARDGFDYVYIFCFLYLCCHTRFFSSLRSAEQRKPRDSEDLWTVSPSLDRNIFILWCAVPLMETLMTFSWSPFESAEVKESIFSEMIMMKKSVSHSGLKRAFALLPSEGQSGSLPPALLMDVPGLVYSAEYRYRLEGVSGRREAQRAASVTRFSICLPQWKWENSQRSNENMLYIDTLPVKSVDILSSAMYFFRYLLHFPHWRYKQKIKKEIEQGICNYAAKKNMFSNYVITMSRYSFLGKVTILKIFYIKHVIWLFYCFLHHSTFYIMCVHA